MDYLQYFKLQNKNGVGVKCVLNLIINGLPSIPKTEDILKEPVIEEVLNLIINGLPSIHKTQKTKKDLTLIGCFKPYYKWITFNTKIKVAI